MKIFKVRSAARDSQTDRERLGSLARNIHSAIESVRAERDALRSRVNDARDRAALVAGTGVDDYVSRDVKDAAQLREYENQMIAGDRRISELEHQLDGLSALSQTFNQFLAPIAGLPVQN